MINSDITAIGSPYVHSNNGGNQTDYTDNLSAEMWNNLSQAVETAHTKINSIALVNDSISKVNGSEVYISSTDGNVKVQADSELLLSASSDVNIVSNGSEITFTNGNLIGNSCTLSDILVVINYFKDHPETGMEFPSA